MYADNPDVWDDLALHIGAAYHELQYTGFPYQGETWYVVCIGVTGDSPFIAKIGHLQRNFSRVPKRNGKKAPAGICWQCMAGQQSIPFEDVSLGASWRKIPPSLPWKTAPPLLRSMGDPSPEALHFEASAGCGKMLFFCYTFSAVLSLLICLRAGVVPFQDIWHNFHGGLGRQFIASSIAELAPLILQGSNLDEKIAVLVHHYHRWRLSPDGMTLHYGRINRDTFGLESLQTMPTAAWNKFNDTRVMFALLQDFLTYSPLYQQTELTREVLLATQAANQFLSRLFRCGSQDARAAGRDAHRFLCKYATLADATLKAGRLRYPLIPKLHYVCHAAMDMQASAEQHPWTLSPMGMSVQLDEAGMDRNHTLRF